MPLTEAEKWLDHLGSCSPCYGDFSRFRKSYELRRKRTLLAVAASILIATGIAGWVLLQRHNEGLVAQTAVLDLRNRSLPRGTEPNPAEPPLVVSRAATRWNIYLPLGSSEGSYEMRITTASGDPIFTSNSTAKIQEGVTSLRVDLNLSSVSPGLYVLQLRKLGSEWNSYPVQVR
jgi:hypothetical protein